MKGLFAVLLASLSSLCIAQELQYRLSVPDGWDHWVLFDDPGTAWGCYVHAGDPNTTAYIEKKVNTGLIATYKSGAIAVLTDRATFSFKGNCVEQAATGGSGECFVYPVRIVSGDDKGKEGWVSVKLVELTEESKAAEAKREEESKAAEAKREEESKAAEAKRDAAEAQRRKQAAAARKKKQAAKQAEEDARLAEQEAERTRIRNACAIVYSKTADKKVSDLTVRESQQVQACQALGLYPPT
jgi:hypothetical protein